LIDSVSEEGGAGFATGEECRFTVQLSYKQELSYKGKYNKGDQSLKFAGR
jgi:hypothetical protein